MVSELRSQIDKLDGQTELYLVLCLLALALFLILLLVACNCAMSCCQCHRNRKKEKRYRDEKHNDDYYQQIHSLLQRQQTVEREWEERRRIRDEYRLLTPEQAAESLSRLASRSSSPARTKRKPTKSSLKIDNDFKDELANYKVNHSVRIKTPEEELTPTLKRKSWSAILDGKEIQLSEENLSGGSMVIVRRYEPIKIMRSPSSFKKDKQQASNQFVGSDKKRRSQRPSLETIV